MSLMDSSVLELFSVEEILDRLNRKAATGCLHIFTALDSANVFFKEGLILSTMQGTAEGPEVLQQVLAWKDVHITWQEDMVMPALQRVLHTNGAPAQLPVQDLLANQKPKEAILTKPRVSLSGSIPTASDSLNPVIMIPARGATTGPIQPEAASITVTAPVKLTATKNINLSAEEREANEQRLLQKHKLVFVAVEKPEQKFPIKRVSSLIGRNPACDIVIPHASISRQHCLLQITERGLHVKDLDTTNGTQVNGITLKEGYINAGDKVAIGHVHFVLEKA